MIRTKKQKIITLSLVFVAVLTLAIGFAAFSNNLLIKSKLRVEPNVGEFSVVFSSNASSVQAENIVPVVSGSATAEEATIDNTSVPTLNNINATFKTPGDKVVYNLYAYNNGAYDAYLTNVIFNNAEGQSTFKVCTADAVTTQTSVDNACESIKVTVKVNTLEALETQTVTNHLLTKTTSETVTVTIEYLSTGYEADGPFTVNFGDISLVYSSVDGSVSTNDSSVSTNDGSGSTQRYYSWSYGGVGRDLPSDAKTTVSELNPSYPFYLGLDVDSNNKVTAAYACFVRNETEYCLKGYDREAFAINTEIIKDAYAEVVDTACSFGDVDSTCRADGLGADADSDGVVGAYDGHAVCYVSDYGNFECYES